MVSVFEENTFEQRLKSLTGQNANGIDFGRFVTKPKNQSPTLDAINFVRQSGLKPENPDEIVARFADGKPFDPIHSESKVLLMDRYREEVAQLRQRTDITLL